MGEPIDEFRGASGNVQGVGNESEERKELPYVFSYGWSRRPSIPPGQPDGRGLYAATDPDFEGLRENVHYVEP